MQRARNNVTLRTRLKPLLKQRKRQQLTLARAARDYHERVIEPRLSVKHAAQWIASLENHVPSEIWNKPIGQIDAPELLAEALDVDRFTH